MLPITITTISTIILLAGLMMPNYASAGVPTEQVRTTVDRVLEILKDARLNSPGAEATRRLELRKTIFPRFDFQEMAKRSLGAEWRRRSPMEQQEFVNLFTELLKTSYVKSIEAYRGNKVTYGRESKEGNYAEVETKITDQRGEEFDIDYRLMLQGAEWKVYDVIIENVSIVNNYRSQFSRILNRSSFVELLQAIREKVR